MHDGHARYLPDIVDAIGVSTFDEETIGEFDCQLAPEPFVCTGLLQI